MKGLAGFAILLLLAYLAIWPVPIEPQAWIAPGYVGAFEINNSLESFDAITLDDLTGPEAIAVDSLGNLYATTHQGWIVRWSEDQRTVERWVDVGGRPLGFAFDRAVNLWVANAYIGIQKITLQRNGDAGNL